MNFQLSEQQKMIQQTARQYAQSELLPRAAFLDEESLPMTEHLPQLASLGFMGMMVPPEFNGLGLDMISYLLAIEEISAACASTAVTISVHNPLFCGTLVRVCNQLQKEKYLSDFASGKKLGGYALSEPGTGSDAANQQTTAVKKGNQYILRGTKNWITSGPYADAFILFAMSDKSKGNKGISAFIVEKGFSGFSVGKIEKKMGIRGSYTSSIILDDCVVPEENLILGEGQGFQVAMSSLDYGRISIAAQALGIARAAYEAAVAYAKEREAFGKRIGDFQAIQWMLADMSTRIEASRLLTYKAAALKDAGLNCTQEASQAKLFATETSNFVTNKALQIHGGYGYSREYPLERYLRDARVTEIYEGTSEIQRLVIARNILK